MQPELALSSSAITDMDTVIRRRVNRHIMPFLFLLYFVAYLDRVNVSFAGLRMTKDLNFSPQVFGFGAGIFFVGYMLLEIPGALMVEHSSAKLWFTRILVCWGFCATALAFIQTPLQFYSVRFLLGLAEGGFFPGAVVYLSHWYRKEDRAKAVALFMVAIPFAEVLGAPLSGWLLQVHWLSFAGWRWMFLLEGLPAILLGIITLWYLPNKPSSVSWLTEEQVIRLAQEVDKEQVSDVPTQLRWWTALKNPGVLLLAVAYCCILSANYGFGFWLPKLMQAESHRLPFQVSLLVAVPYLVEIPVTLWIARRSDRTGERRWHAAIPMMLGAIAFAVSQWTGQSLALTVTCLCLAAMGMHSYRGIFWALFRSVVPNRRAAAAGIGLISGFGNLGGFVGPYATGVLTHYTGAYRAGVLYLMTCGLLASFLIMVAGRNTNAKT